MSIIKVNKEELPKLLANNKTVLIDFYADWCGPCKMLGSVLTQIENENANIVIAKINIDEEEELSNEYDVMSVPSLLLAQDGKITKKALGYKNKEQLYSFMEIKS